MILKSIRRLKLGPPSILKQLYNFSELIIILFGYKSTKAKAVKKECGETIAIFYD